MSKLTTEQKKLISKDVLSKLNNAETQLEAAIKTEEAKNRNEVYQKEVNSAKARKVSSPKTKAAKKKKAKITWNKAAGASGYEIQYSVKKSFKKAVTVTVSGGTKNKATLKLKKIKPQKKCFIRIRPFTMVNNTKGQQEKVYGVWSKKMKIKVKK